MFRHNLSNQFYKRNYFDLKEGLCLLILKKRNDNELVGFKVACILLTNNIF